MLLREHVLLASGVGGVRFSSLGLNFLVHSWRVSLHYAGNEQGLSDQVLLYNPDSFVGCGTNLQRGKTHSRFTVYDSEII